MGDDAEEILRDSNPNSSGPQGLSGGMGVSSERVGPTGPGPDSTDGVRRTAPADAPLTEESEDGPLPDRPDEPPEQRPGNPEENPAGLGPHEFDPGRNPGHSHG